MNKHLGQFDYKKIKLFLMMSIETFARIANEKFLSIAKSELMN